MNINANGGATEADIAALEKKYKLKLPKDYKEFLMDTDGGSVELNDENLLLVALPEKPDEREILGVDFFYGCTENSPDSRRIQTYMDMYEDELPPEWLIIGDSIAQGFFILSCESKDNTVYFWDDSLQSLSWSNPNRCVYPIGSNFTEFLLALRKRKGTEEARRALEDN